MQRKRYRVVVQYCGGDKPYLNAAEELRSHEALDAVANLPGFAELWQETEDFYALHDYRGVPEAGRRFTEGMRIALKCLLRAAREHVTHRPWRGELPFIRGCMWSA